MTRRNALRIAAVALVVGGLVVGALAFDSYLDPFDDRPFDAAAWAAAGESDRERGHMARDALRQIPPGSSADHVRGLFGEPDWVQSQGGPADRWGRSPQAHTLWTYGLGSWSSLSWYGFDDAFLYVDIDADGRVVSAEITGG